MKLFLIAGEPSGDALGAALMAGLRDLCPNDLTFAGVGGPLMAAEGLQSLFPMEELTVMGLIEIVPKYRHLKARIAETAAAVLASGAEAMITIDSPDFCLRVARAVRAERPGLKTIHYVAPTVWAWRPGRAAKMAPLIDHVLALFPFEPPYMQAAGMGCDFVGHPVVAAPRATAAEVAEFRETHMISDKQPLLLCLPGSRRGEVSRLLPRFRQAIDRLSRDHKDLRVALPTVRGVAPLVRQIVAGWDHPPLVLETAGDKAAAFAAADLALAASGTVSLELAANRVPMVIAHDFNRLTWWMMKRAALIDTVTLVNIVSDSRAVPEFLGPACRPAPIAAALNRLLTDQGARDA
ncbi:MAG: lipid-A-disaccharide synthase, partial [Paracoccaceae bacterium]